MFIVKYSEKDIKEAARKTIKAFLFENQQQLMVPNPQWMASVFSVYNKKAFGGFLKTPQFSTECDSDEWGCYYPGSGPMGITNRFTMKNPGTLCLNGRLKRTKEQWIGTMLHEMCHMYVYQNGMSKYKDAHGPEFWQIAEKVNSIVKSDGVQILKVDDGDVIEANGDEEYAEYKDANGNPVNNGSQNGQIILMVISNPNVEEDKYWICPLKQAELQTAKSVARKIKGAQCKIFIAFSNKLSNIQTDPSSLSGFGGKTYNDAAKKLCSWYGEWNYKTLSINNMKPIQ